MVSRRPGAVALLLIVIWTAAAAPAQAQVPSRAPVPADYEAREDWDQPTGLDNSWFNTPECINWLVVGSAGFVAEPIILPRCLQDKQAEDQTRETVKAENRWLRGGLMTLATIWQTVHAVRQIVDVGRSTIRAFQALTHGLGDRVPSQALFRLADASDAVNQSAVDLQAMQASVPLTDGRLTALTSLVTRALATAKDGQEASVTLGDQAAGMQVRLASGSELQIVGIGAADGTGARRPAGPYQPPLPTEVEGMDGEIITDPGAVNAAVNTSDEGQSGSSAAPRATSAPGLVTLATAAAPVRSGTANAEPTVCAVPVDMRDNTTSYQQIVVMSQGAQTAAVRPAADVAATRAQVAAATMADEGFEAERDYLHLLWNVGTW